MGRCRKMNKLGAIGSSGNLYRLIGNTGPRSPNVSKVIKESDGTPIHSQYRRLASSAEHFRMQFSWPTDKIYIFHLCLQMNQCRWNC